MKRLPPALTLGLMLALAGSLAVALAPWVDIEETLGLQGLFNMRGPTHPPSEVVIIAIDEQSARKLGLPDKPRDWPRSLHAELVHYLAAAGARVVCFDMTFDTPSAEQENDDAFARAIGRAQNVLLTESIRREVSTLQNTGGGSIGIVTTEQATPPIPDLQQAALGYAPFLLPKTSRVNWYWTFWDSAGDTPTLPVLAFHAYASDAFGELRLMLRHVKPTAAAAAPATAARPSRLAADTPNIQTVRRAMMEDAGLRDRTLDLLRQPSAPRTAKDGTRLIRSLVQLHTSGATSHLNFYGPPRTIQTVPYFRVLEAARSEQAPIEGTLSSAFKDKAVFVGYSAATPAGQDRLRDDYRTVYSEAHGLDLNGVEILATAFANLLEDRALKPATPAWQLSIVIAWGLALGWACRRLRPLQALAVVGAMAGVWLTAAYALFDYASFWLPFVIPLGVQAPLALFAGVWFDYRNTKSEREAIRQAFGYYVPTAVVDQLARTVSPAAASNRVVFGACLASDAQNYTALAETMDPGELGALMNAYYAEMFVPVERRGGVVMDVVGDAMVAIWVKASSDAELRMSACEAALDIIGALDRFNQRQGGRQALPTRLGLHSGEMLVGSIGGAHHYEYRAVGDIVNTASRIQGLNKVLGTQLLASQATVDGMDRFVARPLGSFLMAGKSTAVSVVELLGRKENVASQQSALCAAFAEALNAYRSWQWRDAAARFSHILRNTPEDGPSRFYGAQCQHLLANPPGEDWTPTIRISTK